MATLVQHPAFAQNRVQPSSGLGAQIASHWDNMGVFGRRAAVTAVGAVFALTCGVAVADVVRLPADMQGSAQADQMTAQTELPAEAAARTYALENPPVYNVQAKTDGDVAALPDASTDFKVPADEEVSSKVAYTSSATDDAVKAEPAAQDHDAVTDAPAAPSSVTTATSTEDDSGV